MNARGFRLLRAGARLAGWVLDRDPVLPAIERRLLAVASASPVPVVLVVGAPRSGTTLAFDLVTSAWPVAYPTNLMALLARSPALGWRLSAPPGGHRRYSGESRYGVISGVRAPSEARALVERWFGPLEKPGAGAPVAPPQVRATLASLGSSPRAFVFKNLGLGLRPARVEAVLPDALYLRVRRTPLEVATSLLVARRVLHGDERTWFGIRPPGSPWLDALPVAEQIAWQIRLVDDALEHIPPDRVHTVEMDALRARPQSALEAFGAFCACAGVDLGPMRAITARPRPAGAPGLGRDDLDVLEAALTRVARARVPSSS